jgi:hypothetical protein
LVDDDFLNEIKNEDFLRKKGAIAINIVILLINLTEKFVYDSIFTLMLGGIY